MTVARRFVGTLSSRLTFLDGSRYLSAFARKERKGGHLPLGISPGHLPPCIASWFHDRIGLLDKSPYRFERCLRLRLRNSESRPCQHFTDRKLALGIITPITSPLWHRHSHLSIQSIISVATPWSLCPHFIIGYPYNRKCLRLEICGPCHACLYLNLSAINKWQWRACLWRWFILPGIYQTWFLLDHYSAYGSQPRSQANGEGKGRWNMVCKSNQELGSDTRWPS